MDKDKTKVCMEHLVANEGIQAMPLYTAHDTTYGKKEHYGYITKLFKEETNRDGDYAVALIDTIEKMSEEIFEHYKLLIDLMKSVMSQVIKKDDIDSRELMKYGYAALKGYRLGALQHEKYLEFGIATWNITANNGENRDTGIEPEFREEYLLLGEN